MPSSYDRRAVSAYLARLVAGIDRRTIAAREVVDWLGRFEGFLEIDTIDIDFDARRPVGNALSRRPSSGLSKGEWNDIRAAIEARAREYAKTPRGQFETNLDALCDAFGLDDDEKEIVDVAARYSVCPPFETLCDDLVRNYSYDSDQLLAALTGLDQPALWRRLGPGRLMSSGLITVVSSSYESIFVYNLADTLKRALSPPNDGLADVERALIGAPLEAALDPADFDHVAQERDFLADLLTAAVKRRERGINVLLYGPPGTGKTELCKTLARQVGLSLYAIGEQDEYGDEPKRSERLSALMLGQKLAAERPDTVLLFDEMEDFLGREGDEDGGLQGGSKVFLNRLLEDNAVPVLWTANQIGGFTPAFLRRMTYVMELSVPPAPVRETMWRRLLRGYGMALDDDEVEDLARRFDVAPALAANAVRSAQLAGAGFDGVVLALTSLGRAVDPGSRIGMGGAIRLPFVPRLANADADLIALADRLVSADTPQNFSLCLYGPPGTGKSAFVRHLAQRMRIELRHIRASDLLSSWVGETEQRIAEAFRSAAKDNAFLVIDEADSLLYDRTGAARSWEVTQVNEMLTWMEHHPLPFAVTTNLMDHLDQASLRRFTFKVQFGFLNRDQVALAFETYFGMAAPAEALDLAQLTPGDFAVVAKKIRYMKSDLRAGDLARLLRHECELKPGLSAPMGFR